MYPRPISNIQYLHNLYNYFFFCLYGVKIQGLFQRKGPRKEKSMANNNNMYIIMFEIDDIHMLQLSTPNKIGS